MANTVSSAVTVSTRITTRGTATSDRPCPDLLGALLGGDQHLQPGRVEERHAAEVDHQVGGLVAEGRAHLVGRGVPAVSRSTSPTTVRTAKDPRRDVDT